MNLQDVRFELQWDPDKKIRLYAFDCGVLHLRQKADALLKEKKIFWKEGLTRHGDIRENFMSWLYGLLTEFSDPKGIEILRIARELDGHPARGKVSIDDHPYKLGLHSVFINPTTRLSRFSPRVRQTWGDIMMFAHACSVAGVDFQSFREHLSEIQFSDADIFHWVAEGYRCSGWGAVNEEKIQGCDGCGMKVCKVVTNTWGNKMLTLSAICEDH